MALTCTLTGARGTTVIPVAAGSDEVRRAITSVLRPGESGLLLTRTRALLSQLIGSYRDYFGGRVKFGKIMSIPSAGKGGMGHRCPITNVGLAGLLLFMGVGAGALFMQRQFGSGEIA